MYIYKQTYYKPNLNTMKNIFRILMAVAVLFTASCAKEDISSSIGGGEANVTFTVDLPELGTRAYADGANADILYYKVFDATTNEPLPQISGAVPGSKAFTVNIPMLKGMTYDIVFWAQKNTDEYYELNGKVLTVKYDANKNANDNDRDAFYAYVDDFDPTDPNAETDIPLYRPFGQLNAATSDYEAVEDNGVTLTTSTVTVETFTQFDLENGIVLGDPVEVTFEATAMPCTLNPAETLKDGYKYLSMNYLLPGNVDAEFTFKGKRANDSEVVFTGTTYTNVPLKSNYRTNILGALLTKPTDFNVTIDPAFGIPDIDEWEQVADGVVLMNNTYLITSLNGLKWFAKETDGVTRAGGNTFKGKTVQLGVDIDLENNLWTPIASNGKFEGKFDGGNHTISNLKVKVDDRTPAGLFARASYVSNLKLENVSVEGHYKAGAVVGDGLCSRINNCHVKNAYIKITPLNEDDGNHAGGIVGYLSAESEAYVTNCSVTDANIIAYRDCGGIAGTTTGATCSPVVKNNSLKDVEIVANQLDTYNATKDANAGEVVGRNSKNIDLTSNTCDNVHADVLKKNAEGNIEISNIAGVSYFAELVDAGNTFAQVDDSGNIISRETIELTDDIDISTKNWDPIGDNRTDGAAFSGIFDGQEHTITGAHITGDHCFNGNVYGSKEGWGLFSVLDGATVKNLKVDGAIFGSYTVISGVIAGYANNTTFENIDITNSKVAGYNWYTGGVVGWAQGECTFKDINLDNTVAVGTLWDSHGQNVGGIAGGISSTATITIEDCNIACVLDVINDVTSNYKWYIYRVSGMIIGNTNTTETKYNEVVTATATNVTCNNVTVTYGQWMNYHYCQGYWNRGWGRVESSDYVGGVDHTQCNHPDGEEHCVCIPFDQLFGGSSNGSGHYPVKGLAEFPGVTVVYPAEYTCPTCGQQHGVQ